MADYKEKFNEVRDSVKDAAANIASEENKQKLADATSVVAEKTKGLNKKTIGIIAIVIVALIAILSLFGGGKLTKEMKEQIENDNTISYYGAKNLKLVYTAKHKNSMLKKEVEYFVSGQYKGNNPRGQYFICDLYEASDGKATNWNVTIYGEYADKKQLQTEVDKLKGKKVSINVEDEVKRFAAAMDETATDIKIEKDIQYQYNNGGVWEKCKCYYVTAKVENKAFSGEYSYKIYSVEVSQETYDVGILVLDSVNKEDLSSALQNAIQKDEQSMKNNAAYKL